MGVDSTAHMIQSVDGRVRLTTKSGAVFDACVIRTELFPKTLVVRAQGFTPEYEGFTPELLYLPLNKLRDAKRCTDEALPEPDPKALKKALARPRELPPKTSKAATKRATKALKEVSESSAIEAVRQAIACDLDASLIAPAVEHLSAEQRTSLLREAVAAGSGHAIGALLPAGGQDSELLVLAVATGKLFAVRALIEAGVELDAVINDAPVSDLKRPSSKSRTALHWALVNGHAMVVGALLDAGASLVDQAGLVAAAAKSEDLALFKRLLAAGLDPNVRDPHGHPIVRSLGAELCYAMLDAALAAGADANARYPDGSTLLLRSLDFGRFKGGHTMFVKHLLDAGADPNLGRLYGRSALALAEDLPFDPGEHHGERWLEQWVKAAGGEVHRDPDAPPLPEGSPPPPPPPAWKIRIDPDLARAPSYALDGARVLVCSSLPEVEWSPASTPVPEWDGYGPDAIALVRAKLQHLAGAPLARGDEYKITFEYAFEVEREGAVTLVHFADWKARGVHVAVSPAAPTSETAVELLWELLTISPLAPYEDRFRYDEHAGCRYRSDGVTAYADFPKHA